MWDGRQLPRPSERQCLGTIASRGSADVAPIYRGFDSASDRSVLVSVGPTLPATMALPTKGRVIIDTTVGEIDVELWSKVIFLLLLSFFFD